MQARIENVSSISKKCAMKIITAAKDLLKFCLSNESLEDGFFAYENEYFNSTEDSNIKLAKEALASYAAHGKSELVYKIMQIIDIPLEYELIEQLLNNTNDYTANNVVALYNLSHLPDIENKDIPIIIASCIFHEIIPKMDSFQLAKLKNQGLPCFNHAITKQEYSLHNEGIINVDKDPNIDASKLYGEIENDETVFQ